MLCHDPAQSAAAEAGSEKAANGQTGNGNGAKKQRTWGNVIFDWGVYGSVAWAGVSAFSLATAHLAMNSKHWAFKPIRGTYQFFKNGTATVLENTIMKNTPKEKVGKWAKGTALYFILGAGGSALMGIIKYMEDNRQRLAAKIDNVLGTTPPDCDLIAQEPKQTWTSVLAGRALSVIGVGYGSFVAMGPENADKISEKVGGYFTKGWMKLRPKSDPVKVRKVMDVAAFDVLFTIITAAVTYAFSRFVAKKHGKELDAQDTLIAIDRTSPTILSKDFVESLPERKHTKHIQPKEKIAEPAKLHTQKLEAQPADSLQLGV